MSRPTWINGLHPIMDEVQEVYAELLSRYHNWKDWDEESYDFLEKRLREISAKLVGYGIT